MRKLLFSLVLAISSFVIYAQSPRVSIFGGPQITSVKYTINNKKQSTENKYGFQVGASVKVPFENRLYFAPAAYYSLKGYKVTFSQVSFPPDTAAIDNNT